jgi:hypothetical protein
VYQVLNFFSLSQTFSISAYLRLNFFFFGVANRDIVASPPRPGPPLLLNTIRKYYLSHKTPPPPPNHTRPCPPVRPKCTNLGGKHAFFGGVFCVVFIRLSPPIRPFPSLSKIKGAGHRSTARYCVRQIIRHSHSSSLELSSFKSSTLFNSSGNSCPSSL